MSRNTPDPGSLLARMPHWACDYTSPYFETGRLGEFDGMVFAAGNDLRHFARSGESDMTAFFRVFNEEAIPRFFSIAKSSGIPRAVYLGTFYPRVAPAAVQGDSYLKSRVIADQLVRKLNDGDFMVCSCDLPFVIGDIYGASSRYLEVLIKYAQGKRGDLPLFAPPGGSNFMSCQSMAEAVCGALAWGKGGRAYLVGDENLTWKAFLELWFRAANNLIELDVRWESHPLFPDELMYAGVGATISYEPSAEDRENLCYSVGSLRPTVARMVKSSTWSDRQSAVL